MLWVSFWQRYLWSFAVRCGKILETVYVFDIIKNFEHIYLLLMYIILCICMGSLIIQNIWRELIILGNANVKWSWSLDIMHMFNSLTFSNPKVTIITSISFSRPLNCHPIHIRERLIKEAVYITFIFGHKQVTSKSQVSCCPNCFAYLLKQRALLSTSYTIITQSLSVSMSILTQQFPQHLLRCIFCAALNCDYSYTC